MVKIIDALKIPSNFLFTAKGKSKASAFGKSYFRVLSAMLRDAGGFQNMAGPQLLFSFTHSLRVA